MADLYGLEASGLPPELIARLTNSREGMKVAEALLAQSMRPVENMGGPGASLSWTQGAAKIAEALLGQRGLNQAAAERSAVADEAAAGEKAAMEAYQRQKMGVPGVTPSTPMDDEGNVMPSTPAVPGDPMGAVVKARMSPYLKNAKFLDSAEANINRIAAREDAQANTRELRQMQQDQRQWEVKQAHQSKMEQIREAAEQGRITQAQRLAAEAEAKKQHAELLRSLRPEPLVAVLVDGKPVMLPASQAAGKPPAARGGQAMSATAQKELIQTDEEVQAADAAKIAIEQAESLSAKAMGGVGSGMIANAASILPDSIRPQVADDTLNLDNVITESALPQLKAIFGGMPTEGERKVLLDIQGSSSKPHAVRKEIFARAKAAVARRQEFAKKKAASLRAGTYFAGDGAAPAPSAPGKVIDFNDLP